MNGTSALVLVTTSFPIRGDGSEAAGSFVSDLVEELARHVPVRVVAPGPASVIERWSDRIQVFRYAAPAKPLSNLRPWLWKDLLATRKVMRSGLAATQEAVRAGATMQILALWALPSGVWAQRVARDHDIPYSVWTLGSDIWSLGRLPLVRSWLRSVLVAARRCYSDGLQLARDTETIARREVEFLPSTRRIELSRDAPARRTAPYRLLFLGRWHRNKGVDLLLDALEILSDDDWALIERAEICGGGPLEDLVRARALALQSRGRPVEVRGYLNKAAAEKAILNTDYLLIPSRIESIPVVFSDAMKLGAAVVSMPVGDLATLVSEKPACGIVSNQVNASAFAAALAQALRTESSKFTAGIAERAARFDLAGVAARILAIPQSAA